jgi:Sec-independent protein translocase protein TatA
MFGLSFPEILLLAALGLILLGPEQLPDLARSIGKFLNELKRTRDGFSDEIRKSGLHPSSFLDELDKEKPKVPPVAGTPPADLMPPEKKLPTGNDESGS